MPADRRGWDAHTHLVPATVTDAARRGEYDMALDDGHLLTPMLRFPTGRITDPEALVAWLDDNHLEGAVVSPPPPLYRPDLDDTRVGTWVDLVNGGMAEACAHERLRALAYLPAERPGLAAELAAGLDGSWVGVTLGTDLGGLAYSDPSYRPVWETLAARGLPAFVHPGHCPDTRLGRFYLTNLVGNPHETTVAAAHLVFGDVPGRHPDLRVLLAHGGGAVAALVGRWQQGYDTDRPGIETLTLTPREAIRRFWVDSLVHDPSYLRHVVDTFGPETVVLGSDWPFPMGESSPAIAPGRLPGRVGDGIRLGGARLFHL
ncbi:MAG: amidohydrolase family protein [Actinomycetota bacterium]